MTDQKLSILQARDWWHSKDLGELVRKNVKSSLGVDWLGHSSHKRVRVEALKLAKSSFQSK